MRFPIFGGSDAGISAALRAHKLDSNAEITVLLEDEYALGIDIASEGAPALALVVKSPAFAASTALAETTHASRESEEHSFID